METDQRILQIGLELLRLYRNVLSERKQCPYCRQNLSPDCGVLPEAAVAHLAAHRIDRLEVGDKNG